MVVFDGTITIRIRLTIVTTSFSLLKVHLDWSNGAYPKSPRDADIIGDGLKIRVVID